MASLTDASSYDSLNDPVVTPRRYRVFTLREFILDMYSIDYLKSGYILDIAGGKGDLSWLLTNADGLDSVVIDPRVTDHTKLARTCEWLLDHPFEATERSLPNTDQFQPLTLLNIKKPFKPARHLRIFVDQLCVDAIVAIHGGAVDTSSSHIFWHDFFTAATERALAIEGKLGHHQPKKKKLKVSLDPKNTQMTTPDAVDAAATIEIEENAVNEIWDTDGEQEIVCDKESLKVFQLAKLYVGFHPDEATEAIIDLAIHQKVPFMIVPCCVFPKLFKHRRLNGESVSTYKDFINYLRNKHPGIRMGILPFHAKSGMGESGARGTVLYTLPGDYDLTCISCTN